LTAFILSLLTTFSLITFPYIDMKFFLVSLLVFILHVAAMASGGSLDADTSRDHGNVFFEQPVTVQEYALFLNEVASDDTYGLYNNKMTSIMRCGDPGSYSYLVLSEEKDAPLLYIDDLSAAIYSKWLNKGHFQQANEDVFLLDESLEDLERASDSCKVDASLKSNQTGLNVIWSSTDQDNDPSRCAEVHAISSLVVPEITSQKNQVKSFYGAAIDDLFYGGELFSAHVLPEIFEQGLWAVAASSGLEWPFIMGYIGVMGSEATYEYLKGHPVLAESIIVHMACDLSVMLGLKLFGVDVIENLFACFDAAGLGCIRIPFAWIHDVLHESADYILSFGRVVNAGVEEVTDAARDTVDFLHHTATGAAEDAGLALTTTVDHPGNQGAIYCLPVNKKVKKKGCRPNCWHEVTKVSYHSVVTPLTEVVALC